MGFRRSGRGPWKLVSVSREEFLYLQRGGGALGPANDEVDDHAKGVDVTLWALLANRWEDLFWRGVPHGASERHQTPSSRCLKPRIYPHPSPIP
eukprot:6486023-Amphidinium_carterae.1